MNAKKNLFVFFLLILVGGASAWWWKKKKTKGKKKVLKVVQPEKRDLVDKRVISGEIAPCKEVELKSNISGILDKLYVEVGNVVHPGAIIARIKPLTRYSVLEKSRDAVKHAEIDLATAETQYQRNRTLYEKEMISLRDYEGYLKAWQKAKHNMESAQKQLSIQEHGYTSNNEAAGNLIRATIPGKIMELPFKEGASIGEQSGHSEGSIVAVIGNVNELIFKGQIGEMEVHHLKEGMHFDLTLNTAPNKKLPVELTKIAPKSMTNRKSGGFFGGDSKGAKFEVEGKILLSKQETAYIRAGYTATAEIILARATDVLSIEERYVHSSPKKEKTSSPKSDQSKDDTSSSEGELESYVWIKSGSKQVKRVVTLGVSDGLYVEIKKGLEVEEEVITNPDSK